MTFDGRFPMRGVSIVLALPLLALAACGGAGLQAVGSVAPVASGPTQTINPGTGAAAGVVSSAEAPQSNFLSSATAETNYSAIGAIHSYKVMTGSAGSGELYAGNASSVRSPSGTITYNPRDGIFEVVLNDSKANITSRDVRFQDPGHRSDFNPTSHPSMEVPNLPDFNYLDAGYTDANGTRFQSTFFYQRPNATTYVTLAGFAHKEAGTEQTLTEHGAMVFGSLTPQLQIPTSGKGEYTGGFLASAVLNPTGDTANAQNNYLQWINGSSTMSVDFGKSTVALALSGKVGVTYQDGAPVPDSALTYPGGTSFAATASAAIDLARSGGFTGTFNTATLGGTAINFQPVNGANNTAGASSVDGAFFGPNAVNVGGNFRIVGGTPDQRMDIQGAFTGAKKP
jgi:hypothetical protein